MTTEDQFDRIHAQRQGLPGYRAVKPSTIRESAVLMGNVVTFTIETMRCEEYGVTTFLEIADAEGNVRVVLPDKVVARIASQRESVLKPPPSPAAAERARKRRRLDAVRKADHDRGRHRRTPVKACKQCARELRREHREGRHQPRPPVKACPSCS